jgi:hypothetical protein
MRLYLDTTILNDAFVLSRSVAGENLHARDFKLPPESWMLEYVALFYPLDLDDQWDVEFGTSWITQQEIDGFPDRSDHHGDKKAWLIELYEQITTKTALVEMSPIPVPLRTRITIILPAHKGKQADVVHICQAILGGCDRFVTTDRDSILTYADKLQDAGITLLFIVAPIASRQPFRPSSIKDASSTQVEVFWRRLGVEASRKGRPKGIFTTALRFLSSPLSPLVPAKR